MYNVCVALCFMLSLTSFGDFLERGCCVSRDLPRFSTDRASCDAAPKGIAPLSINKRRRGVRGWEGVNANGYARKRLFGINLTAY